MRTSSLSHVTLVLTMAMANACGATRPPEGRSTQVLSPSVGAVAMEIPPKEISSLRAQVTSAYDLIRRLRPTMLASRDPSVSADPTRAISPTTTGVIVYVDGVYIGGLDVLSSIAARSIISIKRISPASASVQFGTALSAGAIIITTQIP